MQRMPVWDPLVRLLHWGMVLCVAIAWLSTLRIGVPLAWHEPAGYVAMAIVALRLAWGFIGPRHARFRAFVRAPQATWRYALATWRHRAPRHIGHNPLGGWMVVALLGAVGALTFSGWLQTTDRYWGSETLEEVHLILAWSLLGLVAAHVCGVFVTSRHQRENLVLAMVHGRKRPPSQDDVA